MIHRERKSTAYPFRSRLKPHYSRRDNDKDVDEFFQVLYQ